MQASSVGEGMTMDIDEAMPRPDLPRPDRRQMGRTIEDAQELLRYAAQSGIDVGQPTTVALLHANTCLNAGHIPEADAVAFYAALTTLAARVAPVTAASLRTSEAAAGRSLRRTGVISIVLALAVVLFSGIGYVTGALSHDIDAGIAQANDLAATLRSQVGPPGSASDAATCTPATAKPDPPIPFADEAALIRELQDFSGTIRTLLRTATKLDAFVGGMEITPLDPEHGAPGWKGDARQRLELDPGLLDMRREAFCKIGAYQDVRQFAQNVRADSQALYGAISAYLLPVLYALLGAFAYNLRDFSDRVKRRTWQPTAHGNTARTIAAMTAGAIISLFNIFSQSAPLQPLALAFLVGYGVEAFFAFLDTLLTTFRTRTEPARPAT